MAATTWQPRSSSSSCLYMNLFQSQEPNDEDDTHNNQHHQQQCTRRNVLQGTTQAIAATTSLQLLLLPSTRCHALTAQQAAVDYDTYAAKYDVLDGGAAANALGLEAARHALVAAATGHVLEIGAGTGLNLPHYNWQNIKSLTLVDISPGMLAECQAKVQALQQQESNLPPIQFITADATSPELVTRLGANRFDVALDTFSLCVMGQQGAVDCIQQLTALVRPGTGTLRLLENTRADENGLLGWYQDVTANAAAAMGGKGCVYNQNVRQMLEQQPSQLRLVQETSYASGLFRAFVAQRGEQSLDESSLQG